MEALNPTPRALLGKRPPTQNVSIYQLSEFGLPVNSLPSKEWAALRSDADTHDVYPLAHFSEILHPLGVVTLHDLILHLSF